MYVIHGIKNCSTMKKAFTALDEQGISYEFFDYKKQAPTTAMIESWVDSLGIDVVLNKRGTTWRKLTDEQKAEADNSLEIAISLMVENTSMIKRPLLVNNDKGVCMAGFKLEEYNQLEK